MLHFLLTLPARSLAFSLRWLLATESSCFAIFTDTKPQEHCVGLAGPGTAMQHNVALLAVGLLGYLNVYSAVCGAQPELLANASKDAA